MYDDDDLCSSIITVEFTPSFY